MNRTIYIRDEDIPTWDRAKELAGEKLSPVIVEGLRRFIAEKEREPQGFERIVVRYRDATTLLPVAKAFAGRWIYSPDSPFILHVSDLESYSYAIAETAKGRFVVLEGRSSIDGDHGSLFAIHESFSHLLASNLDADVKAAVMEKYGIEVEELDI